MKTTSLVTMALIAVCALGVDAGEPKTSAPARRPVSATNTTTKAQAAQYKTVKTAASRFDNEFQSMPSTPEDIKRMLARMVAENATQKELRRFRDHLIGGKFTYLASSVMVARATSPKEHAMCRCLYAMDLFGCMGSDSDKLPQSVGVELESCLSEALENAVDQEKPFLFNCLVNVVGAYYAHYTDDVDKSWELYSRYEALMKKDEGIRADYLQNIANRLIYGKNRPSMSDETISQMKTYTDQMLLDKNLSYGNNRDARSCVRHYHP
ncbi:MAG: hypothetical protein NTV22_05480 [bacterium]|nr:hypothetical protein [bacterium]